MSPRATRSASSGSTGARRTRTRVGRAPPPMSDRDPERDEAAGFLPAVAAAAESGARLDADVMALPLV